MNWTPWRRRERTADSRTRLTETAQQAAVIRARWPEVRALSEFSKEQRERNHLTELFAGPPRRDA